MFDIGLTLNGPATVATITNSAATPIQATGATLNGNVISTGGSIPQISIYYGTSDGGTNAAAWANNAAIGPQSGTFSAVVTGLEDQHDLFFHGQRHEQRGNFLGRAVKKFHHAGVRRAARRDQSARDGNYRHVRHVERPGALPRATNGRSPRIYYGPADGGTNPAAWANQVSLGAQPGIFNAQVAGLTPNTTYFFTTSASNSAGFAWGGPSKSFTTRAGHARAGADVPLRQHAAGPEHE